MLFPAQLASNEYVPKYGGAHDDEYAPALFDRVIINVDHVVPPLMLMLIVTGTAPGLGVMPPEIVRDVPSGDGEVVPADRPMLMEVDVKIRS